MFVITTDTLQITGRPQGGRERWRGWGGWIDGKPAGVEVMIGEEGKLKHASLPIWLDKGIGNNYRHFVYQMRN